MNSKFSSEKLKRRDHFVQLLADERIILKRILKEKCLTMWTTFIWLRTGTSDEFSRTPQ
jgi:hypothetical protein